MNEALEDRGDLALFHARPQALGGVLHGQRGQFIGQPHALDLLIRLDRASFSQQAGRVNDFTCGRLECVEPRLRPGGRLAHHAIGALRSLRELQSDSAGQIALFQDLQRASSERNVGGRGSRSS